MSQIHEEEDKLCEVERNYKSFAKEGRLRLRDVMDFFAQEVGKGRALHLPKTYSGGGAIEIEHYYYNGHVIRLKAMSYNIYNPDEEKVMLSLDFTVHGIRGQQPISKTLDTIDNIMNQSLGTT